MSSSTIKIVGLLTFILSAFLIYYHNDSNLQEDELQRGFTYNFLQWLKDNNFGEWEFQRPTIHWACYGGAETTPTQSPEKTPIIFIHDNSDIGMGDGGLLKWQTGFSKMVKYLRDTYGYQKSDMYVTTWGTADVKDMSLTYHSERNVKFVRAFIQAVLEYTKSNYVNIIAHGMGVTLARKAIKGGEGHDELGGGYYNLGIALKDKIRVFVGMGGANEGLTDCYSSVLLPVCGATNGFFPGQPPMVPKSRFLQELDENRNREGQWVVTMRALYDESIKYGNLVWGKYTTRIKDENEEIGYTGLKEGHFYLRDSTGDDIVAIFKKHEGF